MFSEPTPNSIMAPSATSLDRDFDGQASSYDRRAGLPPAACDTIAREVVRCGAIGPADVLLEVGVGTGQIGCALAAMPLRYFGFDSSPAMLGEVERRCGREGIAASVAVADASRRWPSRDRSITVIFGSRSLHLLPLQHVVDEAMRVAVPQGAFFLVGRVERDRNGLRARLRREMRERLRVRGHAPFEGRQRERALLDALVARGASAIPSRVAAAWRVRRSTNQVIAAWRTKPGLAGVAVTPEEKEAVLFELAAWAEQTMGSLDTVEASEEKYLLYGVQMPVQSVGPAVP